MATTTSESEATVPRTLACRTVLVPLDGSPDAERAMPTAASLAQRLGARLDVVTAEVGRDELWWYDRYVTELRTRYADVSAAHIECGGGVADTVARLAREAGPTVVCMATHGRGRTAAVFGSTFAAVAAAGPPVLAIGPQVHHPPALGTGGRLVACVDGSEASAGIISEAAAWARKLGMAVTLLTVAEPAARPWLPPAGRVRGFGPSDPASYLASLAAGPELAGLDVDTAATWDYVGPDNGVLAYIEAHPATLLALGSHARRGVARALHGSDAAQIIHGSPVPALVRVVHEP